MRLSLQWFRTNSVACFTVMCVLLGMVMRLYQLGAVPVSLYWDEAAMLVDAQSIAQTGKDMHGRSWLQPIFPSYGDYKLPVYIWAAGASVLFFGSTEWALRLPSALAGVLQIVIVPVILWQLWSLVFPTQRRERYHLAMFAAVLVSLAPWSVLFSRTGFEGHLGQFFVSVSFVLFLTAYRARSVPQQFLWSVLAGLMGAVAVYTYYSIRFVWPVLIIASTVVITMMTHDKLTLRQKLQRTIVTTVLPLSIWSLCLIPMLTATLYPASQTFRLSTASIFTASDYALESNILREQSDNTFISRIVFHRHVLLLKQLASNYAAFFDLRYLFLTGDANLRHGTQQTGVFALWMSVPFFVGWYVLAKRQIGMLALFCVWWVAAILPAAVPMTVPHALRSLNAFVPLACVISIGALQLWNAVAARSLSYVRIALGVFAGTVITLSTIVFLHDYFGHYSRRSAFDWQDGYRQLSEYIYAHHSPVRTVWVNPDDHRLYLWLLVFGREGKTASPTLKFDGYQVVQIDNIVFQPFDWGKLATVDHRLIVVEKPGNLQGTPNWTHTITDRTGTPRFVVAEYGK